MARGLDAPHEVGGGVAPGDGEHEVRALGDEVAPGLRLQQPQDAVDIGSPVERAGEQQLVGVDAALALRLPAQRTGRRRHAVAGDDDRVAVGVGGDRLPVGGGAHDGRAPGSHTLLKVTKQPGLGERGVVLPPGLGLGALVHEVGLDVVGAQHDRQVRREQALHTEDAGVVDDGRAERAELVEGLAQPDEQGLPQVRGAPMLR